MSECDVLRESMPFLLTESLDPATRERAHRHIELCSLCNAEWAAFRETWTVLGDLPVVEVPARVKASVPWKPGSHSCTARSSARQRTDLEATRIGVPPARRSMSAALAQKASRSTTAKGASSAVVARSRRS